MKTILSNDCTKSRNIKQLLVAKPRATRKSALHNQSQILPKHKFVFFPLMSVRINEMILVIECIKLKSFKTLSMERVLRFPETVYLKEPSSKNKFKENLFAIHNYNTQFITFSMQFLIFSAVDAQEKMVPCTFCRHNIWSIHNPKSSACDPAMSLKTLLLPTSSHVHIIHPANLSK